MNRRERWARNIAILTGVLVVMFAVYFSSLQNPSPASAASPQHTAPNATPQTAGNEFNENKIATGRHIFETQGCIRCHAIAGEGNARMPLDDVGKRLSATAIRQWITAPVELKDQMSSRIYQTKQAYSHLPDEDLDALVVYLQSVAK